MKHASIAVLLTLTTVACGNDEESADDACFTACHPRNGKLAWKALPTEGAPSARRLHVAAWTGNEMLVWGGMIDGAGNSTADGAAYDPSTDSWRPIATTGAPSARHSHQAVWTGSKLLVWGGFEKGGYAKGGGAYDPATDSWTPIADAPIGGRTRQSSVWTGSELVVWGGLDGKGPLADGARYSPTTNSWQPLPSGGPKGRASHVGVWTGSEMVVWGGTDTFDWFGDGQHLDVAANAWKGMTATSGAPSLRESSTGLWTGSEVLVWGGWNGGDYFANGAFYSPSSNAWTAVADGSAPTARSGHVSIWTGDELFVWGGCTGDSCFTLLEDGGRYTKRNGWTPVVADANLSARTGAAGVWTGQEVVVFGGSDANFKPMAGGARAAL